MSRTFSRHSRAFANVLLLFVLITAGGWSESSDYLVVLLGVLGAAAAIVLYGYYIASQCCHECSVSIAVEHIRVIDIRLYFVLAPLHIPLTCPHCGTRTRSL